MSSVNGHKSNDDDYDSLKKPVIIFCHGSGDTGQGVQAWVESLVPHSSMLHQFDWIFPTAEPIPYQLNGGMVSSVWYDRVGGFDPSFPEQTASVEKSTDRLMALLDDLLQQHGQDYSRRIIIGGFSMGGAIAYQTAARWHALPKNSETPLGGVLGLSCYLNHDSKVWSILQDNPKASQLWPPTFVAHGASDDFILPEWGKVTYERFVKFGIPANFRLVPNTHHEMISEEIVELLEFVATSVADQNNISNEKRPATTAK